MNECTWILKKYSDIFNKTKNWDTLENLKNDNLEDAINAYVREVNNNTITQNQIPIQVLYSSSRKDLEEKIKINLKNKNRYKYIGVNRFISMVDSLGEASEEKNDNEYGQIKSTENFYEETKRTMSQKIGTLFHKCLEQLDEKKNLPEDYGILELFNYIEKSIKFINENPEFTKQEKENLINRVPFMNGTDYEFLKNYIYKVKNVISEKYADCTFMSEAQFFFPLSEMSQEALESIKAYDSKYDTREGITGIVDAIVFTPDNKIILLDYKTHFNNGKGVNDRNALQLYLYKEMLMNLFHIKEEDIKVEIVDVLMNNIKLVSNVNPVRFSSIASNIGPKNKAKLYTSKTIIVSEDANEADLTGNIVLNKLFKISRQGIKEKESLKDYIIKLNGKYKSNKYKKFVKIEGDFAIVGTVKKPLDSFLKAELEENKLNFKNLIENRISILGNSLVNKDELKSLARSFADDEYKENFRRNLIKYTDNYRYVPCYGLESKGFILMQNILDKTFDIIKFHNYDLDTIPKMENGNTILGDKIPDNLLGNRKNELPICNMGNLERIRALALLHEFSEDINLDNIIVNDIVLVDAKTGLINKPADIESVNNALYIYNEFVSDNEQLKLNDKISINPFIKQLESYVYNFAVSIGVDLNKDAIYSENINVYIEELEKALDYIKKTYLINNNESINNLEKKGVVSDYDALYKYIGWLIITLKGFDSLDYTPVGKYSLDYNNTIGVLDLVIRTGEVQKYAKNGQIVTGVAQGMDTSMAYANPDKYVNQINAMINANIDMVRHKFYKECDEINKATEKYLSSYKSKLSLVLSFDNNEYYKLLFRMDGNKINPNMILLNPYKNTKLDDPKREYLKVILWNLNKYRMKELTLEQMNMTYEEFSKHTKDHEDYIKRINSDDKYLFYPLKRAGTLDLLKGKFNNLKNSKTTFKDIWNQFEDAVNLNNFIGDQKLHSDDSIKKLKMYNRYSDASTREKILENKGPEYFEFNVNDVVLDFIFSNIKETVFNDLLKNVDRVFGTVRLIELMSGQDMSDVIKTIFNRVKITLFNQDIREDELELMNKFQAIFRKVMSLATIAFRPALLVKEIISALTKLLASGATGYFVNEGVTEKEMLKALGIVYNTEFKNNTKKLSGSKNFAEFSLIGELNAYYGIANFDFNIAAQRLKYDRFNIKNLLSRTAYVNATASDFYHRMSYFVACMIHDGTFEAYSLDNTNKLKYDMSKDKRFSEFWKNRYNPEKASNKKEFYKQKALYEILIAEFNKDGYDLSAENFDELPQAYTSKQKASINETINTIFGAYDHELSTNFQHGQYAHTFLQFLTYLPTEIKKWAASGKIEGSSGKYVHKKNKDGKLLYTKGIDPATGQNIAVTEDDVSPEELKNLQPILEWQGHPVEGLFVSFFGTLHDIFVSKNFKEKLKSEDPMDKQRIANTKLFLFNMLIGLIMALILDSIIHMTGKSDEDISASLNLAFDTLEKGINESNLSSFSSLGDIASNAAGLSIIPDVANRIVKVASVNDYELLDLIEDSVSSIGDLATALDVE